MSDEEERKLERLTALGDLAAKQQLERMRARLEHTVEVFMNWDDLVDALKLTDTLIYFDGGMVKIPDWIDNYSWEQSSYWLKEVYEGPKLTDDQKIAVSDQIRFAVEREWMPQKHLKDRINEIVDPINEIAAGGLQAAGISDREDELTAGLAIEYVVLDDPNDPMEKRGVLFRLRQPFLTAYVEGAFWEGFGDEGMELTDMEGHNIVATARRIQDSRGDEFFKIRDSGDYYEFPSDKELEKAIADAAPEPKKPTKKPRAKKRSPKKRGAK